MCRLTVALAFVFALSLPACESFTMTAGRSYFETAAHPEASRDSMFRAARRVLDRMGWQSVREAPGSYRISAVLPDGPTLRNALALEVKEHGEVLVWLRTEMLDENGRWIAPVALCDSYSFAREREIADRIGRAELRRRLRTAP